jgi:hypothetical protein
MFIFISRTYVLSVLRTHYTVSVERVHPVFIQPESYITAAIDFIAYRHILLRTEANIVKHLLTGAIWQ